MVIQQGDIILKSISSLPGNLKRAEDLILQHGERTGHRHQFTDNRVQVFVDASGTKFISVPEPAQVFHEEHNPITVSPGNYVLDIVREFNYDTEEIVRVVD
jgi:hypothetical protein